MGDLIKRTDVLETLEKVFEEYRMAYKPNTSNMGFASAVPQAIREIPEAYDVDKVIEQLEDSAEGSKDSKDLSKYIAYKQSIEIVRAGGKEPFPSSGSGKDI